MSTFKISIPPVFQSELRYVEAQDLRSDEEILQSLTQFTPVSSEKNVWTYWHAGVHAMPSWCQRNIINWIRMLGPSWTVRVIDTVPDSPNHALEYLDASQLPESFIQGTMTGPYVGPHSADFLRGAALHAYGGVWMDVGIFLIRHLDRICWDILADDSDERTMCVPWMFAQHVANHFVAARKGDEFIKKWHELFMYFWKDQKDYTGIVQSPLIGFVKDMEFAESEARGFKWNFQVDELTVLGYIGQVLAFIRCSWLIEPNGGFNGVEHFTKKVLLYDVLDEDWAAETVVGFKGKSLFDVLSQSRNADPESEEYKKAHETIWRLLTKSSMQKITHGKNLTKTPACGVHLDMEENEGIDIKEGSFAELLRYGSLHLEQTRDSIHYVEPIRPAEKVIIRKGLLEP